MNPLPVPVCASVFVMAHWAQFIRDAQGWKLCQQYPRCPSRPADRPVIGPADWNQGSLCSPPTPPWGVTLPQSYFISCQFCPASHCLISPWFSTNSAKSPTPTMSRESEREKDCKRRVLLCWRDRNNREHAAEYVHKFRMIFFLLFFFSRKRFYCTVWKSEADAAGCTERKQL